MTKHTFNTNNTPDTVDTVDTWAIHSIQNDTTVSRGKNGNLSIYINSLFHFLGQSCIAFVWGPLYIKNVNYIGTIKTGAPGPSPWRVVVGKWRLKHE
jgi:hypothetical protein